MKTLTAKQLKNRMGDAMLAIERGEHVALTRRGKLFAVIIPADAAEADDAHLIEEIRESARGRPLPFRTPEEYIEWSRGHKESSSIQVRSSSRSRSRTTGVRR